MTRLVLEGQYGDQRVSEGDQFYIFEQPIKDEDVEIKCRSSMYFQLMDLLKTAEIECSFVLEGFHRNYALWDDYGRAIYRRVVAVFDDPDDAFHVRLALGLSVPQKFTPDYIAKLIEDRYKND